MIHDIEKELLFISDKLLYNVSPVYWQKIGQEKEEGKKYKQELLIEKRGNKTKICKKKH